MHCLLRLSLVGAFVWSTALRADVVRLTTSSSQNATAVVQFDENQNCFLVAPYHSFCEDPEQLLQCDVNTRDHRFMDHDGNNRIAKYERRIPQSSYVLLR